MGLLVDAASNSVSPDFLPLVIGLLGLLAAGITAVGGYFGLKATRHKAGDQDKALTNLINELADTRREKEELRDRVTKQAAHIEIADKTITELQAENRRMSERVFYLEKQEEKWQTRLDSLQASYQERLVRVEEQLKLPPGTVGGGTPGSSSSPPSSP